MSGLVFMSYARDDADRVRPLVDLLSSDGIAVWWDADIQPGERFRDAIDGVLAKASCVVVVWTKTSVERDWVRSEADGAMKRGVLIPVLLDADSKIPRPFTELEHIDLTRWTGRRDAAIERLLSPIRRLCARRTYSSDYMGAVLDNEWAIDGSTRATTELSSLASRIKTLKEVLILDEIVVRDVRDALAEVANTYRVVMDAVKRFVRPAIGAGPVDPEPFLDLEAGVLNSDIENGRGHCLQILTIYGRAHGLRDRLVPRLDEAKLKELDEVFGRLGTADGDLFAELANVGRILTNESRIIVNLLLADQENAARQRIKEGRQKIEPVQEAVGAAQRKLGEIQTSLGFAADSGKGVT
jgi:TIR domain